ncbi:MAG: hypothetical protein CM1200mP38_4650 [Dehalococcoidia bacterium]|nr:MAG: hypothetical protein CM1200mP38_4650 [Dehalococcoidia bacterium]
MEKHAFAQAKQIIELKSIFGKIEASHGIKSFARDPNCIILQFLETLRAMILGDGELKATMFPYTLDME